MKFERIAWNDAAEAMLMPALCEDCEGIKKEVQNAVCRLWKATDDDNKVSYFVTRSEGSELVVVAYAGNALVETTQCIIESAKAQGFATLRAHTKSLSILRMHRMVSPHVTVEYISRLDLGVTHGRQEQIDHAIATANDYNEHTRH